MLFVMNFTVKYLSLHKVTGIVFHSVSSGHPAKPENARTIAADRNYIIHIGESDAQNNQIIFSRSFCQTQQKGKGCCLGFSADLLPILLML